MALALAGSPARTLHAQQSPGVSGLFPVQSLDFGIITVGIPERVAVTDAWRRGEFRLEGSGSVDVRFVLPTSLQSRDGQTLPLQFRAGDGAVRTQKTTTLSLFNPTTGTRINLTSTGGIAWLYLGGTALPAPTQSAGSYTATVVVILNRPNQ